MKEQALGIVDVYIEAWNEPLADKRGALLARAMTEQGSYVDPNVELASRQELHVHIGEVLSKYPGRRIVRTSEVDVHHMFARFHWQLVKADGTVGQESIDFIEFARDGRIARVMGFFGSLVPSQPR